MCARTSQSQSKNANKKLSLGLIKNQPDTLFASSYLKAATNQNQICDPITNLSNLSCREVADKYFVYMHHLTIFISELEIGIPFQEK